MFILRSICYIYIITVLALTALGYEVPKIAYIGDENAQIYLAVIIILAIIPLFGISLAVYFIYKNYINVNIVLFTILS